MKLFFAPPTPRVLAHRGLAVDAPENTLLAFENATKAGALYLELDVHASRDGQAVVSHDPDLKRLAQSDAPVASLTLSELRGIDLGSGQTFSTLGEVLTAFPTSRFNIDVKDLAAVHAIARDIDAADARGRVLITSFSERRRRAAVRLLPGVATSASSTIIALATLWAKLRVRGLLRFTLRNVQAVQIPESSGGIRLATRRMIDAFHHAGVEVHIWTVNEPATMERLLDLGIDGLVTDRADVAVRLLEQRLPKREP